MLIAIYGQGQPAGVLQSPESQKMNDTASVNKYLNTAYEILKADTNIVLSKQWVDIAFEKSNETNYAWGMGRSQYLYGKIFLTNSNYASAMECFAQASKYWEGKEHRHDYALAQMQRGIVLYSQNQFEGAIPYFTDASVDLFETRDKFNAATCQYLAGLAYSKKGDFAESENLISAANKIFKELKVKQRIIECLLGLAELNILKKDPNSTSAYLDTLSTYIFPNPDPSHAIVYYTVRAKMWLLLKNYSEAEKDLNTAYALFQNNKSMERQLSVTQPMIELYRSTQRYDKALKAQEEYYAAKDSIFSIENTRVIAYLENTNKLEKQKSEILLLSKKVELERTIRFGLMALAAIVLFFALNAYKKSQKIKIANSKLSATNSELATTISNLKQAQTKLLHSEKMASLGRLTAGIAHEIKNPLNFVINFSSITKELIDEYREAKTEDEKKEILGDITGNIEKIHLHGTRADKIMQNMLHHSHTGTGQRKLTDMNKMCDDYIDFAYQSMRANHPNYQCTLIKSLQHNIPQISIEQQDMSRVILNLLNNAFYAVKDKPDPRVEIRTSVVNERMKIEVKDNGEGLTPEVKERIFEPFFTTKPSGEGTGLGLSICYDIVKAHNGEMEVESEAGNFCNFIVYLPYS